MNQTFRIPSENLAKLRTDIAKLSGRNKRNGGSGINVIPISGDTDASGRLWTEVRLVTGTNVIEKFEFIATLDHSLGKTIVREMLGKSLPSKYFNASSHCDHCNINRLRHDTYVLRNVETGDHMQVGSACMKEMFETDPAAACRQAEAIALARTAATESEGKTGNSFDLSSSYHDADIPLDVFLAYAASAVERTGRYVSAKENSSTASTAWSDMIQHVAITDAHRQMGREARNWARGQATKDDANSYLHNIARIADCDFVNGRALGLAASIFAGYLRMKHPKASPVNVGSMQGVIALLKRGAARLQNPKITLNLPDFGIVVLNIAKSHHKVPGSVNVCSTGGYGSSTFYGRIMPEGDFHKSRFATPSLETGLRDLAHRPAEVAAAHGHLTGRCCFCNTALTNENSTAVGYGPVCADNYGLPYGAAATREANADVMEAMAA